MNLIRYLQQQIQIRAVTEWPAAGDRSQPQAALHTTTDR